MELKQKKVAGYETQTQCKQSLIAMQAHAQSSRQAGRQTKAKRAGDLRQASKRCLIRQCRISELTTVCREIDRVCERERKASSCVVKQGKEKETKRNETQKLTQNKRFRRETQRNGTQKMDLY